MYEVTNRVIKSVRISEKNVKFNIILLESNKETNFTYENVDEDRDKKMEEDYYKFIKKWNN
jgi:hypothetical protein